MEGGSAALAVREGEGWWGWEKGSSDVSLQVTARQFSRPPKIRTCYLGLTNNIKKKTPSTSPRLPPTLHTSNILLRPSTTVSTTVFPSFLILSKFALNLWRPQMLAP
ncbi:hypothetical protein Hamer_G013997 [Homarus americanus]|uniref:Uncharacterized protein n=1 Tax=Homarus americanus TaxID=6706 RepID=A0A8J5JXT2_HOMAM|nr:hypothetical protein Hamer_G013997 [Homarus americanus]